MMQSCVVYMRARNTHAHARARTHTTLLQLPSAQHAHMNPARARCL